jgi:uncharacterized protein
VRETHISWVFLTGRRAYKLKKPLVLPFLDYGTPAQRLQMCREEVRLNRRLAPDLYLAVRGLAWHGDQLALCSEDDRQAVDYLVEMRRWDENRTLAAVLDRGELTRAQIEKVGRNLARFHAVCPAVRSQTDGSHRIHHGVCSNAEQLLGLLAAPHERADLAAVLRFMSAFVESRSRELDERARHGLIREGHGDLRAEHVLVTASGMKVVDCVEFDSTLRTLDVADDLAFLVMDLAALGGDRFGGGLLAAYRRAGGDCGQDALVAFFAAHRALVRAKVLLIRAAQRPRVDSARGHATAQARELMQLADRFTWRARLPLVLTVCGLPASGKSFLSHALAEVSELPHLNSDVTRKELAGIHLRQRAPADIYGADWNARTYAEIGRLAAQGVAAHGGAVVDATFRHRSDRLNFQRTFGDVARVVFIECQATAAVLAARAARRAHDPRRVSDADLDVVLRERSSWEGLDEVPARDHIVVRTDRSLQELLEDVRALLDRRL